MTFTSSDFDGNGNEITPVGTAFAASTNQMRYYPDNRSSSVYSSSLNQTIETDSYDIEGRLVLRNGAYGSPSPFWLFTSDGRSEIMRWNGTSWSTATVTQETVNTPTASVQVDWTRSNSPGVSYLQYDPQGNAAILTDPNGNATYCGSDLYGTTCTPQTETNFLAAWGIVWTRRAPECSRWASGCTIRRWGDSCSRIR
jgi:hypothetical protein